jgi:hypothetical protein
MEPDTATIARPLPDGGVNSWASVTELIAKQATVNTKAADLFI